MRKMPDHHAQTTPPMKWIVSHGQTEAPSARENQLNEKQKKIESENDKKMEQKDETTAEKNREKW